MASVLVNIPLFAAYTLIVGYLSLSPAGGAGLPLWDKAMHFTVYAVYAMLAARLSSRRTVFYWLCLAIAIYSGLLEFGQSFVPGREMSALDMLANAMGVGLAAVLALRSKEFKATGQRR